MYGAPTPPHPRVQLLPGTSLGRVYFRWHGANCHPLHTRPASFRHQPLASSYRDLRGNPVVGQCPTMDERKCYNSLVLGHG